MWEESVRDGGGRSDVEMEWDAGLAGGVGLGGTDPEIDGAGGDEAFTFRIHNGKLAGSE